MKKIRIEHEKSVFTQHNTFMPKLISSFFVISLSFFDAVKRFLFSVFFGKYCVENMIKFCNLFYKRTQHTPHRHKYLVAASKGTEKCYINQNLYFDLSNAET